MNDDQPTQPLTDAELMAINYNLNEALNRCGELYLVTDAPKDMRRLLVEVDRLRSALTALGRNEQAAGNRSLELQEENDRLRKQVQDYHQSADAHVAKFDRQHDRLMQAEGRIAATRELHQPVTVDWSTSPKCKASHGVAWVNWPCPDALALGMAEHGKAPNR